MSSVSRTDNNLRAPSPESTKDAWKIPPEHFRSDCIPHVVYNQTHLLQAIPYFKHCRRRTLYLSAVKFLQCYRISLHYILCYSSSLYIALYVFSEIGKLTFGTSLVLLCNMDWWWEHVKWSQHSEAKGEISNDKSIVGHPQVIITFSQFSVHFSQAGNMQSAILLSFVASSSLWPCGLQSSHPLMPCYISPYEVYNIYVSI